MSRYDREPEFDALVKMLIIQTKNEKLRWEPTARENVFACAAKGQKTFVVTGDNHAQTASLQVADQTGKVLFSFGDNQYRNVYDLFVIAQRQAQQIDEKVSDTLKFLESL